MVELDLQLLLIGLELLSRVKFLDHISAFWDVLPTLSELTGEPIIGKSDGISILPTLYGNSNDQKQHSHLYWEL